MDIIYIDIDIDIYIYYMGIEKGHSETIRTNM
jgi:hypothetical protein